jgi:hypothetical protein
MAENKYKKSEKATVSVEQARNRKPHRERKNPHAADLFAAQRRERNAARGKQVYAEGEYVRGTL